MNTKERLDKHITRNYNKYVEITRKMSNGINESPFDIVNETLCEIYELSDEKKQSILDGEYLDYYIIQIIKYSLYSPTSRYNRKYNLLKIDRNIDIVNFINSSDEPEKVIDIEKTANKINEILNECNWYDREVVLRYVHGSKSFQKMSNETKIPVSSLWNTYRKTVEYVKNRLNENKIIR